MSVVFDLDRVTDSDRVAAARCAAEFIVPPDEELQEHCAYVARVTQSQMSFSTLVFEHSHHVIAEWGFPEIEGDELTVPGERQGTFERTACAFLVAAGEPVSFHDTRNFEMLKDCLPLRSIHSYSAAPLRFRGEVIGSFGVCDFEPRALTKKQFDKLVKRADQVSAELKARDPK